MTENACKKLELEQEKKILRTINAEEEVQYGLTNDYMFRSVFQTSEDAAFYNEYALKNRRTGYEFTGKIALHVLDLSCLEQVPEEERNSALYYWACVFKAKTWKEVLAMAEQSESIKKAVVTLRQLSEEEKIRLQCEARERYRMDWQSSMRTSREQGREEGRAEERANTEREKENAKREKERADQAELLNRLTSCLLDEGRFDDCKKAIKDIEYRKQLMKEYKI